MASLTQNLRKRLRKVLYGPTPKEAFTESVRAGLVVMGRGSYGSPRLHTFGAAEARPPYLIVGNYCSIAEDVQVLVNGGHRTEWTTTFPIREIYGLPGRRSDGHPVSSGPVAIGSDVWIGRGAMLMGGTIVGHGAVIGAGAVVASDVRPYAIVVGNPAREIRRRFDDETVRRLIDLEWWLLAEDQVASLVHLLCATPDLDALENQIAAIRAG